MSDMPRRYPVPPEDDHNGHDVLLVAQLAAHDPLPPDQQRAAEALVARCPDCAALAADLTTVSRIVAWEPTPPRRRDYRISPEQARRARGSWWQRFWLRLSLPQAQRLGPLAAATMSLGILLVVAGGLWPAGGPMTPVTQPASAPALAPDVAAKSAAPLEPPALENGLTQQSQLQSMTPGGALGQRNADTFADHAATPPPGAESNAGLAAESTPAAESDQSSVVADDVAGLEAAAPSTVDSGDDVQKSARSEASQEQPEPSPLGVSQYRIEVPPSLPPLAGGARTRSSGSTGEGAVPGASNLAAVAAPEARQDEGAEQATASAPAQSSISFEQLLMVAGLILAVGGGVFLVLIWLARRAGPDALIR